MTPLPTITLKPYIKKDELGFISITFDFPNQPVIVEGGDEAKVYYQPFKCDLGHTCQITRVWRFIGLDRGDIGEFDINLYTEKGLTAYLNSFHKEVPVSFESWRNEEVNFNTRNVTGNLIARVTADNELLTDDAIKKHRNGNRHSARVHFGMVLFGMVV